MSESVASQSQQRPMLAPIDQRAHKLTFSDWTQDRSLDMAVWRCGRSRGGPESQTGNAYEPASRKCIPIKEQPDCRARAEWGQPPPFFFLRKRGGLVGNGGYPQAATAFHALGRARAYPNAFQQMPNYFFLSFDVHSYRRFSFPKQGLDSITNGILKKHILARDAVIS